MKKTLYYFLLLAILAISNNQVFGQYAWTKDSRNPVLSGAGDGTWNKHVLQPSVLFNADSARFEMWFGASSAETEDWRPYHIGFAVSVDGINWTMHPTAVLSPDSGTWDEHSVESPTVIRENGQYKMWYSTVTVGFEFNRIGYAESPDGITWTKHPDNPVLGPGTSAWEANPYSCSVMPVAGGYKMWYGAAEAYPSWISKIGYATSVDGIVWQRDTLNNPILKPGATGQWDDYYIFNPQVLCINDTTYYMWYYGENYSSGQDQIGLATSPDGIVWTKYAANPVLALSPGQWDADYVEDGTVLLIGDTYHMWYTGSDTAIYLFRIGHATSPLDTIDIIETEPGITPYSFNLKQNYPNPFNPSTTIKFQIPNSNFVTLEIYNQLGQRVATLVNENLNAGSHTAIWNAAGFASGVYLYRLQAGKYTETKKLILLR